MPFVRDEAAKRLKALGHGERLRIVEVLAKGPAYVGEVADKLGLSINVVSRHLRELHAAGLVARSARGNHVLYVLADREVQRLVGVAYRGAAMQVRRMIESVPSDSATVATARSIDERSSD